MDQEDLNHNEGSRGFSCLCKLVAALGYRDRFYRGGPSDLMVFFEDNPGAIQAVVDWIEDNQDCWADELESELEEPEEEEEEE